jgi:hypothetical protein
MIKDIEVTYDLFPELAAQHYRRQNWHVLGPIPVPWIARMSIGPSTLQTALAIKLAHDLTGQEPMRLSRSVWRQFGMSDRHRRKRALDALERVGIMRTERPLGQAVRIWLIDKP